MPIQKHATQWITKSQVRDMTGCCHEPPSTGDYKPSAARPDRVPDEHGTSSDTLGRLLQSASGISSMLADNGILAPSAENGRRCAAGSNPHQYCRADGRDGVEQRRIIAPRPRVKRHLIAREKTCLWVRFGLCDQSANARDQGVRLITNQPRMGNRGFLQSNVETLPCYWGCWGVD